MSPAAIIFDFDGTLVDSNGPKEDAFYELAQVEGAKGDEEAGGTAMRAVMREWGKESRYVILGKWLEACGREAGGKGSAFDREVQRLAAAYDELAVAAAVSCAPMHGALELLDAWWQHLPLFVSSVTPLGSLERILQQRGWTGYFRSCYGYPADKSDSVFRIAGDLGVSPVEILVVGDGPSDERSAARTGAAFWKAGSPDSLPELARQLSVD